MHVSKVLQATTGGLHHETVTNQFDFGLCKMSRHFLWIARAFVRLGRCLVIKLRSARRCQPLLFGPLFRHSSKRRGLLLHADYLRGNTSCPEPELRKHSLTAGFAFTSSDLNAVVLVDHNVVAIDCESHDIAHIVAASIINFALRTQICRASIVVHPVIRGICSESNSVVLASFHNPNLELCN